MSPDDILRPPIPRGLDDVYEILRELRHDDVSTSWLGHEHATHRDVVITVINSAQLARRQLSSELGADAQLLRAQRHPTVVPVFATHWLPDGSLTIVRPRVRGTTLRQMVQDAGSLSLVRTVGLLREIGAALDWARRTGISHRGLTSESVCLQQGSDRALVSFGPELSIAARNAGTTHPVDGPQLGPVLVRCSDTATLGRLAWEMLTTQPAPVEGDAGALSVRRGYREPGLADLRPDLPLSVAAEIEGALRCERDPSPRGPMSFVAALAAAAGAEEEMSLGEDGVNEVGAALGPVPSPVVRRGDPESISERTAWTTPPVPLPATPQRRGGGAIMAVTIVAVLVLAAVALFMNRNESDQSRIASREDGSSTTISAGDVEFDRSTIDTGVLIVPGNERRPTQELPMPMPVPVAPSPPVDAGGRTVFAPPNMDPLPPASPNSSPMPSAVATGDPCSSADEGDQQACLRSQIARNDVRLNRTYQELTGQLREDSQAVADLRDRQREWLAQRDADCRSRVERTGTWANAYAQCLAERSDERVRELESELQRRRP